MSREKTSPPYHMFFLHTATSPLPSTAVLCYRLYEHTHCGRGNVARRFYIELIALNGIAALSQLGVALTLLIVGSNVGTTIRYSSLLVRYSVPLCPPLTGIDMYTFSTPFSMCFCFWEYQ